MPRKKELTQRACMYVFPKWSLPLCVTSAEGCANQELVGPILTGTHTLGWFPEAAQMVELRSALPRGTLHHLTRHPPPQPATLPGWMGVRGIV